MPSTYSDLKIELIANGEQSGSWGTTTNTNLGTAIEEAITGRAEANFASDADLTLGYTDTNGTQAFRNLILNVTGTISTTRNLIVPTIDKQYLIENNTTGGQSITVKTSAGTGVTVPNGVKAHVYADGTNVVQAVDYLPTADIDGGSIDGTNIGANSAGTGNFSTLSIAGTAITSTATELNILDGATVTTAELNILDGVTATTAELNILDGVTSTTAELNILDGVTATTAELNYVDVSTLGTSQASKAVTADANGNIKLSEEVQATCYLETAISVGGTTIDCDEGNLFYKTISANTTFSFSYAGVNLTTNDAYAFTLILTVSGTRTVTWPASVEWAGGTAPDAPASGETDVLVFVTRDGGSTWYGFQAGDAMS